MFISWTSVVNFVYVNGALLVTTVLHHYYSDEYASLTAASLTAASLIARNYLLLGFVHLTIRNAQDISPVTASAWLSPDVHMHVVTSSCMEAATFLFVRNRLLVDTGFSAVDIVYFVPMSLLFEVLLDLFHYWSHRALHAWPLIYQYTHKTHHKYPHPQILHAYYHSPADLLITNSVPTVCAILLTQRVFHITSFQFTALMVYKSYTEIMGHSGKKIKTCSFPQCIWLPRILRMPLHIKDHDLHHSLGNCNYSKRFSIWDRLHGTMRE